MLSATGFCMYSNAKMLSGPRPDDKTPLPTAASNVLKVSCKSYFEKEVDDTEMR